MDKKFKILMGLIIIVIMTIIIIILLLLSQKKQIANNPDLYTQEAEEQWGDVSTEYERETVENPTIFFTVEDCINTYLNAIKEQNTNKVYNLLSNDFINSNGINEENVLSKVDNIEQAQAFIATKMYVSSENGVEGYIVEGIKDDGSYNEKMYFIVELDTNNSTNNITPLFTKNYNDIEQIELSQIEQEIIDNGNNTYTYNRIQDEDIIAKYMQYYVKMMQGNNQRAYDLLDTEYKTQRFNNSYEAFATYINEIKNTYNELSIISYAKDTNGNATVYKLKDQCGRYYEIEQSLPMEFTMKLDDYSIETEEFKTKYASATDEVKAITNVDKFMKMINNKDYEHAYDLFNETYKATNFATLDDFKTYIKNNFFEINYYNISNISMQGSYYIATVEIKNDSKVSAESISKRIIVSLGEGTEFSIAIAVE